MSVTMKHSAAQHRRDDIEGGHRVCTDITEVGGDQRRDDGQARGQTTGIDSLTVEARPPGWAVIRRLRSWKTRAFEA